MELTTSTNASEVWDAVSRGFAGDTAVCNWILSAVSRNQAMGDATGFRYWLVEHQDFITGLALFSEGSGRLDLTPLTKDDAVAIADLVYNATDALAGVLGPAATAAVFAGRWTELANVGARPLDGGRVYEVNNLRPPASQPTGRVRTATAADLETLVGWNAGFCSDTGVAPPPDPMGHLGVQVSAGSVWIWEAGNGPEAMTLLTLPAMKTRRIAHVYTPPELRGRGVAAALVAHLAGETLAAGDRCMLHTQLANPSSNGIYRRLGFEAISESTFYEFSN